MLLNTYKNRAGILAEYLKKRDILLSEKECLNVIANMHGFKSWNILVKNRADK